MTSRIAALAWTSFLQLARTRVYLNILVAGVGLVIAALAFEELTADAGGRVLFDVGCAFVGLVVATLSGTIAITAVTRDIETKQAHLVLTRPIARAEFVVARFLTTALLVVVANLALGTVLMALLAASQAEHAGLALAACLFASFEGFILAAVATFFGVGSSSTMSAVFTTTIFIAGRLTGEMLTLIERGTFRSMTPLLKGIHAVLPHLTAFDLTPLAHKAGSLEDVARAAVYGLAYTAAFVAAAAWRFSRRDLL